MKVDNFGRILEATRSELYEKYWKEEYDKECSFSSFIQSLEKSGTQIINSSKSMKDLLQENLEMFELLKNISDAYDSADTESLMESARQINVYMEALHAKS